MKLKNTFFWCLVLFSVMLSAQSDTTKRFPQDFFGVYKGVLKITNSKGEQTIGMEFHLKATDSIGKYQYTLVYIADGNRQERLYNLIEVDAERGEYIVDENNGIILDAKWIDNTLYSMFEVQGNLLTTRETFYQDYMIFEITFANTGNKKSTGTEGENAVDVLTYPISTVQKARLDKVTN